MPGKQRNLEVKAVDTDPRATLQAALALGAQEVGVLHQRDTYFHAVTGRLKLREAPPQPAELIAYARADLRGPKVSLYRIVPIADHIALIDALTDSLGVRCVVEKASGGHLARRPRGRARPRRGAARGAACSPRRRERGAAGQDAEPHPRLEGTIHTTRCSPRRASAT